MEILFLLGLVLLNGIFAMSEMALMWLLGSLPKIGDRTEWEGWVFEAIQMDGNRIEKVRAFRQS